jgi:hypothetical protein
MSVTIEKILAASPATQRGQPTQLSTDAKGERIAYAVCLVQPHILMPSATNSNDLVWQIRLPSVD